MLGIPCNILQLILCWPRRIRFEFYCNKGKCCIWQIHLCLDRMCSEFSYTVAYRLPHNILVCGKIKGELFILFKRQVGDVPFDIVHMLRQLLLVKFEAKSLRNHQPVEDQHPRHMRR